MPPSRARLFAKSDTRTLPSHSMQTVFKIHQFVSKQSSEIAQGVNHDTNLEHEQGAGDQGIMFGYATDETPELMPLPILLAHRLSKGLAEDRRNGIAPWLRPDGKTQVSVLYKNNRPVAVTDAIVSPQHSASISREAIIAYVNDSLAPRVLGEWYTKNIRFHVNPTGSFVLGGPSADAGVTGRKIIVDTYGGAGRHGGGAFSGKDPSKVDRSGAYFCRFIARQLIKAKARAESGNPDLLCHRHGQAALGQSGYLRNRRRECRSRVCQKHRLPACRNHRTV